MLELEISPCSAGEHGNSDDACVACEIGKYNHGDSRDFHDSNEDHIRVREVEQSPPGGTTHTHEYTDEYVDNNYGLHHSC